MKLKRSLSEFSGLSEYTHLYPTSEILLFYVRISYKGFSDIESVSLLLIELQTGALKHSLPDTMSQECRWPLNGPPREKTCLRGFWQSETQTSLLSYTN